MAESVQYLIAQHIAVPLRQEPSNVGIVAKHGSTGACRFIGEGPTGKMDRRRLRSFRFPDVYLQWVDHWKSGLNQESDVEALTEDNSSHYRLVRGGLVVDVGADPIEKVVDYLFRLLIKDDGTADVADASETHRAVPSFKREITQVFATRGLLSSSIPADGLFGHHPIIERRELSGTSRAKYRPQFSQENGALYIMESFDLSVGPGTLESRAGLVAYMYNDIRQARPSVKPISLVKALSANGHPAETKNSMCMLGAESRIVDWSDASARREFIAERERVGAV